MSQDAEELTIVFASQDEALIAMAKSFLESADIEFAMNNEFSHNVWPGGFTQPMEILVRPEDADAARMILGPLTENESAPSTAEEPELPEFEEAVEEPPAAMKEPSYAAPHPEQPFSIRLLVVAAAVLIPIILAILYSLRN